VNKDDENMVRISIYKSNMSSRQLQFIIKFAKKTGFVECESVDYCQLYKPNFMAAAMLNTEKSTDIFREIRIYPDGSVLFVMSNFLIIPCVIISLICLFLGKLSFFSITTAVFFSVLFIFLSVGSIWTYISVMVRRRR
jgi:hypothetical protein